MKKSTIVGLGAVCFIVVFVAIASGAGMYQQTFSSERSEDKNANFQEPTEQQKKPGVENQPNSVAPTSKPLPVIQGCKGGRKMHFGLCDKGR